MKKLIIHIGYPKTATSSIQFNILTPLMKSGKIEYLNHLRENHPNHGNYLVRDIISYILGRDIKVVWKKEASRLALIRKQLSVLSNEGLSQASEKYPTVTSSAEATRNAKKVHEVLSPYFDNIEIMMTVREQSSMIVSQYTQDYYKLSNFNPDWSDFETWFRENFRNRSAHDGLFFDYHAMFQAYADYFGKDNVHVLVYEDLHQDKNAFYRKLARIFEVEPTEVKTLFEVKVHNKTKRVNKDFLATDRGNLHAKLFSIAHRIFRNKNSRLFTFGKKTAKVLIPKRVLQTKIGSGIKIRKLNDEERLFIQKLFRKSNEQLTLSCGLDKRKMIEYGYI